MRATERRLETITANMANLQTPAFKRQSTATHGHIFGEGPKAASSTKTVGYTDFSQGSLERTSNIYDLALMGEGYFAVEGQQGEMYTRNGSFRIDDQGVLLTQEGHQVAWEGARGRIDPSADAVVIDDAGKVSQAGQPVGRLRIVSFADQSMLELRNRGYYEAPVGLIPEASQAQVHQGALERSNVNGIDELVAMIALQREHQSASRLVESLNTSYKRLTRGN